MLRHRAHVESETHPHKASGHPDGASLGKSFWCASAAVTDLPTAAHAAAIATKSLIIVFLHGFLASRDARNPCFRSGPTPGPPDVANSTIMTGASGRSRTATVARMERSIIRGQPIPDYAEFILGPAEGGARWLHPGYKAAYVFIDSKNSPLFFVFRNLSSRKSIASIVPMGLRIRRSTYIFLSTSGGVSSSSLRVPERVMSIAGNVRLSATLRSRISSELPVPLNSSKITSSMPRP